MPQQVCLACTGDSTWRNRGTFLTGRNEIVQFLTQKWERKLDYALRKEPWPFDGNRISVRFQYDSRGEAHQWWRNYGNELWEFDGKGPTCHREVSINDVPIRRKTAVSSIPHRV